MSNLHPSALVERLAWRYAVKQFDITKRIPDDVWRAIERALVLSPSSFGLQPWRFVVITDPNVKQQLPAISWNQTQPLQCSHMVVMAARKEIDDSYVDHFIDSVAKTRGVPPESLAGYRSVIVGSTQKSAGHHLPWNARQVYIALGQLMLAAAMMGVDSCPMEGMDMAAYDKILGLDDSPYTCVVGCALGYRSEQDKYATAAKVRFPASELIQHI